MPVVFMDGNVIRLLNADKTRRIVLTLESCRNTAVVCRCHKMGLTSEI